MRVEKTSKQFIQMVYSGLRQCSGVLFEDIVSPIWTSNPEESRGLGTGTGLTWFSIGAVVPMEIRLPKET